MEFGAGHGTDKYMMSSLIILISLKYVKYTCCIHDHSRVGVVGDAGGAPMDVYLKKKCPIGVVTPNR